MDKIAFLNFLSDVKSVGQNGQYAAEVIKQATGEDVDPAQLEQIMGQLPAGGEGAADANAMNAGAPPEEHPSHPHAAHPHHSEHGGGGHMQLSEEELDHLAAQIAEHLAKQEAEAGGAAPAGAPGLPPPDVSAGTPPMADPSAGGMTGDPMQGLGAVKSAAYIAGFLKHAIYEGGFDVETAVNIYGTQLNNTISILKEAAERESDIQKLASNDKLTVETLAYFEGACEKCAAEGMSYEDTISLLLKAGAGEKLIKQLS